MPDYRVMGGTLRSVLEFPELAEAGESVPTWELVIDPAPPALAAADRLGRDQVRGLWEVELYRTSDGFQLRYGDTGIYQIRAGGRDICWHPPPPESRPFSPAQFCEAVRIDVLGRVLATAMHAQGTLCLHGSAVRIGSGAIGFLAPKLHGKSTLAYALVKAGASLLTDDTLPVELEPTSRVRPGVHSIRVWEDSAIRVNPPGPGGEQFEKGSFGKLRSRDLPESRLADEITPLTALYLLAPRNGGAGVAPVETSPLNSDQAALALVRHAKIGPLLGKSEAGRLLEWCARLSRAVPVSVLRVARGFDLLPTVVDRILRSHGP